MSAAKRIALFYPSRPSNAQQFLRGIFRYARPGKNWEFCLARDWDDARVKRWRADGVIGHVYSTEAAAIAEKMTAPVVETAFDFAELRTARVGLDDRAIGAMAAEHLLDQGFTRLLFIGKEEPAFAARRWKGFEQRVLTAGHQPLRAVGVLGSIHREALAPVDDEIREWARQLPTPMGVFGVTDAVALRFLEVARVAELRVPEDVAVIGAGNIAEIRDLAHPALSSVETAADIAGYEAARLLDQLMAGAPPPEHRVEIPPLSVIHRQSTDVLAVSDPDLATALRFIRQNANQPITVDDVVEVAGVSRSTLERRFRVSLARSPLEEIHRVRIEQARKLLTETDWPISQVAKQCGFSDGRHLWEVFQAHSNDTPSDYRRRYQLPLRVTLTAS